MKFHVCIIAFIMTGCANSWQRPHQSTSVDTEPQNPTAQPTAVENFFTLQQQQRDSDIVRYEKKPVHVISNTLQNPIRKTQSQQLSEADIDRATERTLVKDTLDKALSRRQDSADSKINTSAANQEHIAAWTRYCMHEPLNDNQQNIVDTTAMPPYLTDICIDPK